ncbi:DHHC palmitoyltransferase-domain-containing protein, partial [Spinellus fusiger]
LIVFLAVTAQRWVLWPTLHTQHDRLAALLPLNIGIALLFLHYYLACTTDPGQVPAQWEPPASLLQQLPQDTLHTLLRHCKTCSVYKPPRTHHCRYCQRCVLKMDHHCPWINNCVGHNNYPHFLRFIITAQLTCTYALWLFTQHASSILFRYSWMATALLVRSVCFLIDSVLLVLVVFCLSLLIVYHVYCLSKGQTTLEASERANVQRRVRQGYPLIEFPFVDGFYGNWVRVMGRNPLLWLWP